jgi:hypothetical protein
VKISRPGTDEATGNWAILHNINHPLVTCMKCTERMHLKVKCEV